MDIGGPGLYQHLGLYRVLRVECKHSSSRFAVQGYTGIEKFGGMQPGGQAIEQAGGLLQQAERQPAVKQGSTAFRRQGQEKVLQRIVGQQGLQAVSYGVHGDCDTNIQILQAQPRTHHMQQQCRITDLPCLVQAAQQGLVALATRQQGRWQARGFRRQQRGGQAIGCSG